MSRTLVRSTQFKRDFKAIRRRSEAIKVPFQVVIEKLLAGEPLPPSCRDHALSGDKRGLRDCHIHPDVLLLYIRTASELTLVRLGSHSDLFG